MGGKGGKKGNNAASMTHVSLTLREESSGKKQGHVNAKTMCKVDHLKNLAAWAATEASIPSLGAFFGERLAATTEALSLRGDPSLFVCERCESILQPGHNCTIRIEKNHPRRRHRRKKSNLTTQNNVVYTCHFCSHRNLMRGTPKGYMKDICPQKAKPTKYAIENCTNSTEPAATTIPMIIPLETLPVPEADKQKLEPRSPPPPLPTANVSLLDSRRKKRTRSAANKATEPDPVIVSAESVTSSKRRKKSWTSLKEIAQSNEHDTVKKKLTNLTIPFSI